MRPSRKIKLENVKLCFTLPRLCENEGDNMVCCLPASATLFLHDFAFRLGFVILSKGYICRCEYNIEVIVITARESKIVWFRTGIFLCV